MTVIARTTTTLLIAFCATSTVVAQKAIRAVKASLKAGNPTEALKKVEALETDSILNTLPKLYRYGMEAHMGINDAENEKIYLKQTYDTVKFFNSTAGIFDYILKCDKAELHLLELKGKKPKYHREHREILHHYYQNIGAAGRYFFARKKYPEAMRFLSLYLDIPSMPIWGSGKDAMRTAVYAENAGLYLRSAYRCGQYNEVERYKDIVLNDTAANNRTAIEYLANAAKELGDTTRYTGYLHLGLERYPDHPFFFAQLTDQHAQKGNLGNVLALADSMLRRDSTNLLYLEAKSLALLNLKRYEEAIDVSKKCLALDSTLTESNFYIGAAYCNIAATISLPTNIHSKIYRQAATRQKELYTAALPYMERYREAQPEKAERWAPLLYRIYLTLNKGQQFDEIDKILKTLPREDKK